MQQFVAEPVVVARLAAETRLERCPRATEERGTVDVLMKQQRRAVFCILVKIDPVKTLITTKQTCTITDVIIGYLQLF